MHHLPLRNLRLKFLNSIIILSKKKKDEVVNLQYKFTTNDEVFNKGIDTLAMCLTSDTIIEIGMNLNNKEYYLYFDAQTGEFAFLGYDSDKTSDALYQLGELIVTSWNKYRTPEEFLENLEDIFSGLEGDCEDIW